MTTQQANGAAGYTPADFTEALSTVAQWFSTYAPPAEDDTQAWSSVRSMQSSITSMVMSIITVELGEDSDHTV
ncbi:hypothetical protein H1R20_g10901, partial [Candolleomyces eurysporus]